MIVTVVFLVPTWVLKQFFCQFFHRIHWPTLLSLAVILRGWPLRCLSSIVPCYLILAILYLTVRTGIFVRRAIFVGDQWPLFQKCTIVDRFVFIEARVRCRRIFSQTKNVYDESCYSKLYINLTSPTRIFSKNLSRNFHRYAFKKLAYARSKDFGTLLYIDRNDKIRWSEIVPFLNNVICFDTIDWYSIIMKSSVI